MKMRSKLYWFIPVVLSLFSCEKEVDPCLGPCPEGLKPVSEKISAHCKGYFEYLPEGYQADSMDKKYPVLFFFHGSGETGNGSTQIVRLLEHGPLKDMLNGTFPTSFTVNETVYGLIIIAPQFTKSGVFPSEIDQMIGYIHGHYHTDPERVYLTGLSIGGTNCWQYAGFSSKTANKIAAMVPVAANIDEEESDLRVTPAKAQIISAANIPIWSTHNEGDPLASLSWIINAHNLIGNINPAPRLTVFDADTHEGWSRTYDPEFRENGMNIYEWMLQYHR